MSEQKRGCGYRKIGGLYLVSDPFELICDGLPLELERCQCCGFKPPFSRNLQRINPYYIALLEGKHHQINQNLCKCPDICPICNPHAQSIYGLMFVGSKYYTPETFTKEAFAQGVSKRIPEIPSWLILGETWIFLAHQKVPKESTSSHSKMFPDMKFNNLRTQEPTEFMAAIFYGFKPQRVEMPMWKGSLTDEQISDLKKKGITAVFLDRSPENLKRHKAARRKE